MAIYRIYLYTIVSHVEEIIICYSSVAEEKAESMLQVTEKNVARGSIESIYISHLINLRQAYI